MVNHSNLSDIACQVCQPNFLLGLCWVQTSNQPDLGGTNPIVIVITQ